jgi:transglutaminase-like putative cysteine protease
MRYRISHQTLYHYGADVAHSHQLLHLIPRPTPYQQCIEHTIRVLPAEHERRDQIDVFGNPMTRIEIEHAHRRLEVCTEMEVEVYARPMFSSQDSAPWESVRAALAYQDQPPGLEQVEASRFRQESPHVRIKRVFREYAVDCFGAGRPLLACADALVDKLHADFRYAPGETAVGTPLLDVLEQRRGVCQDFAHLMIACLRSLGLAARYISGYVRSLPRRDEPAPEGASSGRTDVGASHAWVAVYSPPFGWVELDPTNRTRVSTDHIAVAWGRDFGDVSPLRGVILGGGTHELRVEVTVAPVIPT